MFFYKTVINLSLNKVDQALWIQLVDLFFGIGKCSPAVSNCLLVLCVWRWLLWRFISCFSQGQRLNWSCQASVFQDLSLTFAFLHSWDFSCRNYSSKLVENSFSMTRGVLPTPLDELFRCIYLLKKQENGCSLFYHPKGNKMSMINVDIDMGEHIFQ